MEMIYMECKSSVLKISENIRIGECEYLKEGVLNEMQFIQLNSKLEEDMEDEYKEAIRKHNDNNKGGVPKWLWIVLIYFMYDDVLQWLSNTFLFMPILFLISVFSFFFSIGTIYSYYITINFVSSIIYLILSLYIYRICYSTY